MQESKNRTIRTIVPIGTISRAKALISSYLSCPTRFERKDCCFTFITIVFILFFMPFITF